MLKDESVPEEQNAFIMTSTSNHLPCLHDDDGACQPNISGPAKLSSNSQQLNRSASKSYYLSGAGKRLKF